MRSLATRLKIDTPVHLTVIPASVTLMLLVLGANAPVQTRLAVLLGDGLVGGLFLTITRLKRANFRPTVEMLIALISLITLLTPLDLASSVLLTCGAMRLMALSAGPSRLWRWELLLLMSQAAAHHGDVQEPLLLTALLLLLLIEQGLQPPAVDTARTPASNGTTATNPFANAIRTSLDAIRANLKLLELNNQPAPGSHLDRTIRRILAGVHHISMNLSNMTEITLNTPDSVETQNVTALVRTEIEIFDYLVFDRQIRTTLSVTPDFNPLMQIEPARLQLVIDNLLVHAWQRAPDGAIRFCLSTSSDEWHLDIRYPDKRATPPSQIDPALEVVDRIVKSMNGTLLKHAPDPAGHPGFRLTLPIARPNL